MKTVKEVPQRNEHLIRMEGMVHTDPVRKDPAVAVEKPCFEKIFRHCGVNKRRFYIPRIGPCYSKDVDNRARPAWPNPVKVIGPRQNDRRNGRRIHGTVNDAPGILFLFPFYPFPS